MSHPDSDTANEAQLAEYHDIFGIDQYIVFRNAGSLLAALVQLIILLSSFLVLIGVIYVAGVIIGIIVYHYMHDLNPEHVPDFVRNSQQFSSSSSSEGTDFDDEEIDAILKFQERRGTLFSTKSEVNLALRRKFSIMDKGTSTPSKSYRKAQIEKFMENYRPN